MGRKPDLETREKVRAMFEQPYRPSLEEIGRKLNISKQRVSQILASLQLSIEDADVSELIGEICELGGLSITELAAILDMRRENVSRWANRRGLATATNARRLETLLKSLKHASKSQSPV